MFFVFVLLELGLLLGFEPMAGWLDFLSEPRFLGLWKQSAYLSLIPLSMAAYFYFRMVVGKTGTRMRSAASVRLRSPQMPWAFLLTHFVAILWFFYGHSDPLVRPLDLGAWIGARALFVLYESVPYLPVACASCALYYSVRFGALRTVSLLYSIWVAYVSEASLGKLAFGVVIGFGSAFACDMLQNWNLKRQHILVPGFPAKRSLT